ncbi:MAG: YbbR-like domain-containing protein [Candidatus Korobacteraceae bacterium]
MNFFQKYVLHNFWLKVISLMAAVLLWAAVAREPVVEVVLSVPVEFRNPPEDLEISSDHVPQAQVRMRGPMGSVRQLTPASVHAIVDLQNSQPGERTFDLSPARISVPMDVQVVQVVPSQFRISLDRRASKQVEVRPRITGTFASGYRIDEVSTEPRTVTIAGPSRHVQDVDAAITDPIDATGVVGRTTFTASPYVTDPMVRVVSPAQVRVTVVTEKLR